MQNDFSEGINYEIYAQLSEKLKMLEPGTKEYQEVFNCLEKMGKIIIDNEEKSETLNMENKKLSWDIKKTFIEVGKVLVLAGTYVGTGAIMVKYNLLEGRLQGADGAKWFDQIKNLMKH